MAAIKALLAEVQSALLDRRMKDGMAQLERFSRVFAPLDTADPDAPSLLLCIAMWVDAGYRDASLVRSLLARFDPPRRRSLPLADYLQVRMAEAYCSIAEEDSDAAIEALNFVLQVRLEMDDDLLLATAFFWRSRAHRRKGEYEAALPDVAQARALAQSLHHHKLAALVQVQESWLLFQKGMSREALRMLDNAEQSLKDSDDYVTLGNIESARGRIVRRAGEYALALTHFARAVEIYGLLDPHHPNLARALVNAAYVKRLMALHLRKRMEGEDADRPARAAGAHAENSSRRANRTRYLDVCRDALNDLSRAGEIYVAHQHHSGSGAVLVNSGYLHLDSGDIDGAATSALAAYELGNGMHDHILMARARVLQAAAENERVDQQMGEDADAAIYAGLARKYAEDAVALSGQTQNRRLIASAHLARGMTCANDFFREWDAAADCASQAAALLRAEDRDHLWEELLVLKTRILRASGIDDTLRAWSQGVVGDKSFQQLSEDFAEIVIPKVWAREGKKVSRVAERLSVSPKKVRRILRNTGHMAASSDGA